jgi:hypothetical protein
MNDGKQQISPLTSLVVGAARISGSTAFLFDSLAFSRAVTDAFANRARRRLTINLTWTVN